MSATPPSDSVLSREQDDGIVVLTLDRPEAMNALSIALRRELTRAFREIVADPSVGVVVGRCPPTRSRRVAQLRAHGFRRRRGGPAPRNPGTRALAVELTRAPGRWPAKAPVLSHPRTDTASAGPAGTTWGHGIAATRRSRNATRFAVDHSGAARGPRISRPGSAPVASSCSETTSPFCTVIR